MYCMCNRVWLCLSLRRHDKKKQYSGKLELFSASFSSGFENEPAWIYRNVLHSVIQPNSVLLAYAFASLTQTLVFLAAKLFYPSFLFPLLPFLFAKFYCCALLCFSNVFLFFQLSNLPGPILWLWLNNIFFCLWFAFFPPELAGICNIFLFLFLTQRFLGDVLTSKVFWFQDLSFHFGSKMSVSRT